jgi:3-hydroxyisobutyrate dehydrogenase-like beta-hydroxyacid dehydrogenase
MRPYGMEIDNVGPDAGSAALIKMLANVFTKGMAALAFELMLPAEQLGLTEATYRYVLKPFDDRSLSRFVTERLCAPAVHAPRRAQEMAAVVTQLEDLGFDPVVTRATRDIHAQLAAWGTREAFGARIPHDWRHALKKVAELQREHQGRRS